jgi:hypothetical protein
VGDVKFIFEPDPSGGSHGVCITDGQQFLRVGSAADLEMAAGLDAYLASLEENEVIAVELGELSDADVDLIRTFAATHSRAVFVRKSSSSSTLGTDMNDQLEGHGAAEYS